MTRRRSFPWVESLLRGLAAVPGPRPRANKHPFSPLLESMTRHTKKKQPALWPLKYYKGLTRKQKTKRAREIRRFGAIPHTSAAAYTGFSTDRGVKTKESSYSSQWRRRFPDAKSLEERSAASGVPLRFLQASYDRGMAAWRTGHRPGATQQQWGYARVASLLLCGKTYHTTDSDLVREAVRVSPSAASWWKRVGCKRQNFTRKRTRQV